MILTKVFPTEIHALHLKTDSKTFVEEWKACVENKKHDMSKLLNIIEPYVIHWYNLLTDKNYPRDIQISCLYTSLDSKESYGIDKVEAWVEKTDDLKEELRYIACEVIRATQYFPGTTRTIMIEYIFAVLYRNYLKDHIKRQLRDIQVVFLPEELILEKQTIEQECNDVFLLDNATSSRWERYLLYLIYNGHSTSEISSIVKLPRETFYYEEKHLWEKLKNLWCQTQ